MKQKTKHLSKATMSIVLALVLVVSTVAVGIVATNAAYINSLPKAEANVADVAEDGAVGANAGEPVGASGADYIWVGYKGELNKNDGVTYTKYTGTDITFTYEKSGGWYMVSASDDSSNPRNSYSGSNPTNSNSGVNWVNNFNNNNGGTGVKINADTGTSIHVVYNSSTNKYTITGTPSVTYDINYATGLTGGSVSGTKTSSASGKTVQFTATPAEGYSLSSVSVTKTAGGASVDTSLVGGTTYSFTMPSEAVTISATFSVNSYSISSTVSHCTVAVSPDTETIAYGTPVTVTVTPDTNYAISSVTIMQGSSSVPATSSTSGGVTTYSFTMPAGNVSVNAKCRNTAGTITVYFKSATGYVYHPILTVNDGVEQEMTFNSSTDLLTYNGNGDAPYEETGSLRYAWYKKELTGVDTTKEITINIRGKDTYMDATDSYTIAENGSIWLACDNLMEGSTLVNLTSESNTQVKDFYESPLHMVATSEEAEAIRSASGS